MQAPFSFSYRLAIVGAICVAILSLTALVSSLIFVYAVWLSPTSWAVAMHDSTTAQDADQFVISVSWLGCMGLGLLVSWYRSLLPSRLTRIFAISLIVGFGSIAPWILASILGVSWPYLSCGC